MIDRTAGDGVHPGRPADEGAPLAVPGPAGPAVVDLSVLAGLFRSLGDRAPMAEGRLIDAFRREAPRLLEQLVGSLAAGDRETLHRAAHTLKSSCAQLGAVAMSGLSADLEDASRESIPAGAADAIAALETEWVVVDAALSARRRELPD